MKKYLLLLMMHLGLIGTTSATHIIGSDLSYESLGGNVYRFALTLYIDCNSIPILPTNTETIEYCSDSCGESGFILLSADTSLYGTSITGGCTPFPNTCTGGTYTGYGQYRYIGIDTLASNCPDYIFSWIECCRNSVVTNIAMTGSEALYVEAKLNNLSAPGNSSPVFNFPPMVFPCCSTLMSIDQSATDPDGDSLVYSFYTPINGSSCGAEVPMTYLLSFSETSPLSSAIPITLNAATGIIALEPNNCFEASILAIRVDEYRAGSKVGSITRDCISLVLPSIPLGTQETLRKMEVSTFPNPSKESLNVQLFDSGNGPAELSLKNTLGQTILHFFTSETEFSFNTAQIPAGNYILHINKGIRSSKTRVIIQ